MCALFTREVLIALQENNPYRAAGIIMQGTRHFPVCTTLLVSRRLYFWHPQVDYSLTSWVVFLSVGEITLSTAVYDTAQPAHMDEGAGSKSLQQAAQPP